MRRAKGERQTEPEIDQRHPQPDERRRKVVAVVSSAAEPEDESDKQDPPDVEIRWELDRPEQEGDQHKVPVPEGEDGGNVGAVQRRERNQIEEVDKETNVR